MRTSWQVFRILPALFVLTCAAVPASGEPFDTHHRISLKIGYHNFFPDMGGHEGSRPDGDPVVTEDEWIYIWEEGYRIQDFDGATLEIGYEYQFFTWFGVALDVGFYGGERDYDFRVAGFEVGSHERISVFHIDVMPRFHWATRWTDLYGGPTIGYYGVDIEFESDLRYGPHSAEFGGDDHGDGIGWGVLIGFEVRIFRYFGVALEDRLTFAAINGIEPEEGGPLNAGGNVLTLCGQAHF